MRVLPHIRKLDDYFGDFLVHVVCECGACREIQPQALARLVGWKMTLKEFAAHALLEVREDSWPRPSLVRPLQRGSHGVVHSFSPRMDQPSSACWPLV